MYVRRVLPRGPGVEWSGCTIIIIMLKGVEYNPLSRLASLLYTRIFTLDLGTMYRGWGPWPRLVKMCVMLMCH